MRTTLILSIVAACGSSGVGGVSLESGPLIAMNEGDPPRHIHVSGASKLTTDVTWATFDNGDLLLAPPCTTVAGSSGAPVLFYMQLDSTPIVVQVQPSAAGSCAPTLNACVVTTDCTCTPALALHRSLPLSYHGDLTEPDKSIAFTINNPDIPDNNPDAPHQLAFHLTTDSPLKFKQDPSTTSICTTAPNTNIVGSFSIDWNLAESPASEDSPLVATGEYRFDWNTAAHYGLEVQWCAADSSACELHRYTTPPQPPLPMNAQWCIDHPASPSVLMSLGLRLWYEPMPQDGATQTFRVTSTLGSGSVNFTSSTTRAGNMIDMVIDRFSVPGTLTADLGTVASDVLMLTTHLTMSDFQPIDIAIMQNCPPDH